MNGLYLKYRIEITGILAWCIFSFSAVKLTEVYSHHALYAYLLTYNICSIFYIIYFSLYFRPTFNFKKFLLLSTSFNLAMPVFEFTYRELIEIRIHGIEMSAFLVFIVINCIISSITYSILYKISNRT